MKVGNKTYYSAKRFSIENVVNKTIIFFKFSTLHRKTGPAEIFPDSVEWYFNNKRSRLDGPAFFRFNIDNKEFNIKNKNFYEEEFWNA